MKHRETIYAVIAVLSFVAMAATLIWTFSTAEGGEVSIRDLGPTIALAMLFFVNVILAKQNKRR